LDEHWTDVKIIYEQGLATGVATFETESPSWEEWNNSHLCICRFVAQEADNLVGWIALSPVSSRCVYGGVAEISVYVHEDHRGKGIGKKLLEPEICNRKSIPTQNNCESATSLDLCPFESHNESY